MPTLSTIRAGIAELPTGTPLVVALAGGTSGIGSYTAKALAITFAEHGSKLRVYIVGRKLERAEALIQFGRQTSPGSDWRFVQVSDAALISDVDSACKEIAKQEEATPFAGGPPRLDILYLSQALSPFQPSPQDSIKPGEFPVGTPPAGSYGITSVRRNTTFMKTFSFEELAEKNAGKISFVHIYPGLVDGPAFYTDANPPWMRILWRVMKPLVSWYMTSEKDCGDVMVTQRELGGGAYAVGQRGDESERVSWSKVRKNDTTENVWDHTMKILTGVERKDAAA
ncbi:hypothetical protein K504DRAFT_374009 [Pleomassaria siparia CBS 279.74]|uniref:NAD(P)-binding protein n=1 Tax=Pleomassaria siparia CBS 279.74 TaxID=1314801 RepID=A0A6G1KGU0_9PLEO|nr:hypothetical protein K504DRAFT_374009 [Pleomassaria siparia CBS 279.74]